MSNQNDDDAGMFLMGPSVGAHDDLARSALADKVEIDKNSSLLSEKIKQEEMVRDKTNNDCSRASKEMENHVRAQKEAAETLAVDDEMFRGLVNTLHSELPNDLYSKSKDGGLDGTSVGNADSKSFSAMKRFRESATKRVDSLHAEMESIRKTMVSHTESLAALNAEAEMVEGSIASEDLEAHVANARESTSSKLKMLEDIKKRQETLRTSTAAAEERRQEVETEISNLRMQLEQKQQQTESKLADAQQHLLKESEEKRRMEEILAQTQKQGQDVKIQLTLLKTRDAELTSFIKAKQERAERHKSLRERRNRLYTAKKEKEDRIEAKKKAVAKAQVSLRDSEKGVKELDEKKSANDKWETEVGGPVRAELESIGEEKKKSEQLIAETAPPKNTFDDKKARIAELRKKRDKLRQDLEMKKSRIQDIKRSTEESDRQTAASLESLRKVASSTKKKLEEEQKRVEQLKARREKRTKALRNLEILEFGATIVRSSKEAERAFAVL